MPHSFVIHLLFIAARYVNLDADLEVLKVELKAAIEEECYYAKSLNWQSVAKEETLNRIITHEEWMDYVINLLLKELKRV